MNSWEKFEKAGIKAFSSNVTEAVRLLSRALHEAERFGEADPRYHETLVLLAHAYQKAGRLSQAEALHSKALIIHRRNFGQDHPLVARDFANLGMVYFHLGKHAKAERLYELALSINERFFRTLGADSDSMYREDLATHLFDLARVYREQGKYEEARQVLKRFLAVSPEVLLDNDPAIPMAYEEYEDVLKRLGRVKEAEQCHQKLQEQSR